MENRWKHFLDLNEEKEGPQLLYQQKLLPLPLMSLWQLHHRTTCSLRFEFIRPMQGEMLGSVYDLKTQNQMPKAKKMSEMARGNSLMIHNRKLSSVLRQEYSYWWRVWLNTCRVKLNWIASKSRKNLYKMHWQGWRSSQSPIVAWQRSSLWFCTLLLRYFKIYFNTNSSKIRMVKLQRLRNY